MIVEIASILAKPGEEAAFEAAVVKAVEVFRRAKGCKGLALHRCIEEPGLYELVIRWRSLENHTVDFRGSALFQEWRALVGPHFAEPPKVKHYNIALPAVDF
ncbi:MAG TPA: antibiotic biosynthesis monooxygenase family protein [Paracoccaceae bacterium]|nr:antibiotic biosynthesis monooxygenase family protein [Paracoccaceae bacterium]